MKVTWLRTNRPYDGPEGTWEPGETREVKLTAEEFAALQAAYPGCWVLEPEDEPMRPQPVTKPAQAPRTKE